MIEPRVFDVIVDATKVAVTVAVTIWVEPQISKVVSNTTLSAILAVAASAILAALLVDLLLARPEIRVTWFDSTNAPVAISTLRWTPGVHYYYTVRVRIRCKSWIPRKVVSRIQPSMLVTLEVGQDKYLVPAIQNQSSRVALVDAKVVLKMSKISDSEIGEDAVVSFMVPDDATPVEDSRVVTASVTVSDKPWTALAKTSANVEKVLFRGRDHGVSTN